MPIWIQYVMRIRISTPIQKLLLLLFAASCLTMRAAGPVQPLPRIVSDCEGAVELVHKFDLFFPVLYLGRSADTVLIPCGSVPVGEDRKVERANYWGAGWKKGKISVFIDTSQLISGHNYHYIHDPELMLVCDVVKSYSVLVINTSEERNDFMGPMPLRLEYLDSGGTWQPANNNDFFYCGSFSPITRFEAGEMIISRLPVFGAGKMYRLRISAGLGENAVHSNEIYARAIIDEERW